MVRRSCQPRPGPTGSPVARSQTMVVARWLVMPTASTGPAGGQDPAAPPPARAGRARWRRPRRGRGTGVAGGNGRWSTWSTDRSARTMAARSPLVPTSTTSTVTGVLLDAAAREASERADGTGHDRQQQAGDVLGPVELVAGDGPLDDADALDDDVHADGGDDPVRQRRADVLVARRARTRRSPGRAGCRAPTASRPTPSESSSDAARPSRANGTAMTPAVGHRPSATAGRSSSTSGHCDLPERRRQCRACPG